ncbi:aminotransferase class I/II-fold pyridoxal phosphate-dependent enzyme [Demequina lignilytica]|uniref:Aminotransferase n=1 Tax=Demequina lignilytica TaxID=3051663 RepID=A0AB35MEY9_9MICO|nr:aminotransferase class I/II-fold pyridoxal phosphate-dependent enzyme [Demequina sp. SYSU T0a273]MDN4482295.1 aminotransferase class I/II-fold pyridoxal phosphate-dependent enzyme [Demequina sp. SYSU T0a273]
MRPSRRALAIEPFHAMAFGDLASELEAAGHRIVRLNLGEPDFGAPAAVRRAMVEAMDGRPLSYTSALGMPALRSAIAGFYRDRHGVDLDPARVAITMGASAALVLAIAATVDEGDDVLMADPSYPCNRQDVASFGGRAVTIPTSPATRFQLTRDLIEQHWTPATRVVMAATPSNPTGTSIPPAELAAICDLARERGAWRLIDEIYLETADPSPDGTPQPTALAHDPDAIVVSSFSKAFGMTGWRLGWMVLPEALVDPVERLAVNYFLSAAAPVQIAALECFTPASLAEAEGRRLDLLGRRRLMLDGLARIGLPVEVEPDGAFYAFADVSSTGMDAWTFCGRALREAHVALTPGRDFGTAHGDTHVRLSYAASAEDITLGLERLGRWLDTLRSR